MSIAPSQLTRLFSLAVKAMRDEDEALADARSRSEPTPERDFPRGLAYWVFETTLVYAVFKEWCRAGEGVEWEWPYGLHGGDPRDRGPNRDARKADLVLFDGNRPIGVFEFKWWNSETVKTHDLIVADFQKLRAWRQRSGDVDRFTIAFWYSPESARAADAEEVTMLLRTAGGVRLALPISYFPTRWRRGEMWEFAVALMKVDPVGESVGPVTTVGDPPCPP